MTEVVSTSHGKLRAQTQSRETATSSAEMATSNLEILGRIPESLSGRLIRNGPEPLGDSLSQDGVQRSSSAMLHQISIASGRADYRSRRILANAAFGNGAESGVGIQSLRGGPNSGLVLHGGHVRALGALSNPVIINSGLEVESIDDLAGSMPFGIGAHAHVDPVWDEMFVIGASPRSSTFHVGTLDVKGRMRRVVEIATDTPIFIHDFSFTDTEIVILASGAEMTDGGVSWNPTAPAYFGVLPRDGEASDIRWHEVSPRVVWHFMNSYRDGVQIVVDHVAHRAPIATAGKSALLPGVTAPQLRRTQINTLTGETTDEILDDRAVEYPAIDNRRQGLRHRFAYAALASSRFNDHIGEFDALVRYDFRSDQAIDHSFEEGIIVGEPVVVPRRGSTGEDDAWILAITTDTKNAKSSVVVLDPQAFGEAPVAEIKLPQMLPIGHHLLWVPSL
ncbi:lignostilbene-alpha,beta-dioxygenase-like enzyme [Actinobacteria bacterium IMCC26256]|nr:lignostilbene-alpha,beta-dioxygenase-like enzyme [Actinobacteria bacterium IMCC26256]